MKHQPYRRWILGDEPLSEAESRELATHLDSCASCRNLEGAWEQVHARLKSSALIDPSPGFADRFHAYLTKKRSAAATRQVALTLAATVAGAVLSALVLGGAVTANLADDAAVLLKSTLAAFRGLEVAAEVIRTAAAELPEPSSALAGPGLMVSLAGVAAAVYAGFGGLWAAAMFRFLEPNSVLGGDK